MKKGFWIVLFVTAAVLASAASLVYAAGSADSIVETPDVKIMIEGERVEFHDALLSVNQRTMLPVRELLVNLGVKNDDQHIIWDGKDKSVTVYKDDVKISLRIGDKTADVNDKAVQLDAAPLGYKNNRIYIPARFVAQTLGKKVVWDAKTKTVLIRDKAGYNSVKEILDRTDDAMARLRKLKITGNIQMSMKNGDSSETLETVMHAEADRQENRFHVEIKLLLLGGEMDFESYCADNKVYNKDPLLRKWEAKFLKEEEFKSSMEENLQSLILKGNEVLYAGLREVKSIGSGTVLLEGNILPAQFFKAIDSSTRLKKYDVTEYHIEIQLDKESGRLQSLIVDANGRLEAGGGKSIFTSRAVTEYSDFDGDFMIQKPEGID